MSQKLVPFPYLYCVTWGAARQQCYLVKALLLTWWWTDRSWCGPMPCVWDVECDDGRTLVWFPLPVCVSRQAAVLSSQGTAAGVIDGHKLVWSPTCVRRGVWRWADSGMVTVPLWADRQQCYLVTALLLTWLTDRSWCGPLHVWDVECDDGRSLVWLPYLCEQTGSSAT